VFGTTLPAGRHQRRSAHPACRRPHQPPGPLASGGSGGSLPGL